mgnify:FL=1
MARTQTTVADAITAVSEIVSSQTASLASLKALIQNKAAGSGGAALFGVICDGTSLYPISGVTVSEADGVITLGG